MHSPHSKYSAQGHSFEEHEMRSPHSKLHSAQDFERHQMCQHSKALLPQQLLVDPHHNQNQPLALEDGVGAVQQRDNVQRHTE